MKCAANPTVSIVIGVYNGEEQISECLESLLEQDYPSHLYEVIVVENGSTDRTFDVVRKYPVRAYQNPVRGLAPARNFGLERSDADLVLTTDADCVADPAYIAEVVKPFVDPTIGGAGGKIVAGNHEARNEIEQFSDKQAPLINYVSGSGEYLPHLVGAHAAYRRDLLLQIGGFNTHMLTGEDVDVSWRIQLHTGTRLAYTPNSIIYHKHRTTLQGLGRLYRHYGFGEILLDTIYRDYPDYPRDLAFQIKRIAGQLLALPRYTASGAKRAAEYAFGRCSNYERIEPWLQFLIESNNIRGKISALALTRMMTDPTRILEMDRDALIDYLYGRHHG